MKPYCLFLAFCLLMSACKPADSGQSRPSSNDPSLPPVTEGKPLQMEDPDTPLAKADALVTPKVESETPPPVIKPKICTPNFTKLATPVDHHHIYYVTNFNPEEFKCWVLIEEHGTTICAGTPCVIYYVDDPKIKIEPALPHHMAESTLRSHGIGRYEHNGKYWELKGASRWKRKDKGYGYYNTDNQLGG